MRLGPYVARMMRVSPPELARELPGPQASRSVTFTPRRNSCSAVQPPNAPAPITAALNFAWGPAPISAAPVFRTDLRDGTMMRSHYTASSRIIVSDDQLPKIIDHHQFARVMFRCHRRSQRPCFSARSRTAKRQEGFHARCRLILDSYLQSDKDMTEYPLAVSQPAFTNRTWQTA